MGSDTPAIATLRQRLLETEGSLRIVQAQLLESQRRAELAEKSARAAWDFARTVLHRPASSMKTE